MAISLGLAADRLQQHNDINPIAAVGIIAAAQPENRFHRPGDTRLFLNFANDRLLDGLVRLDVAARQLPIAAAMAGGAAHEQQPPIAHHGAADADVVSGIVALGHGHGTNSAN